MRKHLLSKIILTLGVFLLMTAGISTTARAADPEINGKSKWKIGDTINFGSSQVKFYTDVNYNGNLVKNDTLWLSGEYTIKYDSWNPSNKCHELCFTRGQGGDYLQIYPEDKDYAQPIKPWGIELLRGDGSQSSPYVFGPVYEETKGVYTIEKESTVYAGEVFVDGKSQMRYLYSADISSTNTTVLDNLKNSLNGTDFKELVLATSSASGLAVSTSHQEDMDSNWKSASFVAGKYYTGTVGEETSGNMYDLNSKYKSNLDTKYKDSELPFDKRIQSIIGLSSHTEWVMRNNISIKQYTITFKNEMTTVNYTSVNVTSGKAKDPAVVSEPPKAKTLTADGSAQGLVTAGKAENGTMQYVIGKDASTAPTSGWGESIPTGTEAGTYYVWYKAKGDNDHTDSEPACVEAVIKAPEPAENEIENDRTLPGAEQDKEYEVTLKLKNAAITDLNWEVTKGSLPEGLSLDSKTGKISGTPSKEGEYVFTVKEKTSGAEKEFDLTVKGKGTPEIKNDPTLPEAEQDKEYSVKLELTDAAVQDTDWAVTDGALPEGLNLDSRTGEISGKPSKAGEFQFSIKEKTSGAEKKFNLTVKSGEKPEPGENEIKNDRILPEAKQDEDYDVTLELKDSTVKDLNWEVTKGSLPEGLSLDSRTGKISGRPSKEGDYVFTIKEGNTGAEKEFKLTVRSPGSKKDDKKSSKRDEEEHTPASWILNPNEKQQLVIKYTGAPEYLAAGYQEQGAVANELFKAALPAGWTKAFSFNVLDQKRQPEVSVKNGVMTLFIPGEFIKSGRQFALLGMNKGGQVISFNDTDLLPNTVTVNLSNMEGYAFDLIYKD